MALLQELLPEKRLLRHPNLAKAVGSDPLAARIAQLQPDCHIFGCALPALGVEHRCNQLQSVSSSVLKQPKRLSLPA
jgi:hypothetical protein